MFDAAPSANNRRITVIYKGGLSFFSFLRGFYILALVEVVRDLASRSFVLVKIFFPGILGVFKQLPDVTMTNYLTVSIQLL